MFRQQLEVTYRDGRTETVTATQWAIGEASDYFASKRRKIDMENPFDMVVFVRAQAWASLYSDSATRPAFDTWSKDVDDVTPADDEPDAVDSTLTAISGG